MDIAEFLTARYGEDEVAAQACKPGPWTEGSERPWLVNGVIYGQSTGWPGGGHLEQVCMVNIDYAGEAGPANLAHMVRHDPARVLADIAAKRKRLALYVETAQELAQALKDAPWKDDPAFAYTHVRQRININELSGKHAAYLMSVRLDAAPYAEHPDFDPAWRTDG